ncbi:MAG: hypothetical protein CBC60_03775 [Betaproteobacteria bacterium TMED100]|nr:MAG: hypothetical protein CBC60_03775 [Betaproteobacteria bacterium TMED100]
MLLLFYLHNPKVSYSQCSCQCVSGRVQPVCSKAPVVMPICSPRICEAERSKAPIPRRFVPPAPHIKPSNCQQRRVKNPNTNQYTWRTICRPENSFQ